MEKLCCLVNPCNINNKHSKRCSVCTCKLCKDCVENFQMPTSDIDLYNDGRMYHCEQCYTDELCGSTIKVGYKMWMTEDKDMATRIGSWYINQE